MNVGEKIDTWWHARHILRHNGIRTSFSKLFNQWDYIGTLLEHIERFGLWNLVLHDAILIQVVWYGLDYDILTCETERSKPDWEVWALSDQWNYLILGEVAAIALHAQDGVFGILSLFGWLKEELSGFVMRKQQLEWNPIAHVFFCIILLSKEVLRWVKLGSGLKDFADRKFIHIKHIDDPFSFDNKLGLV